MINAVFDTTVIVSALLTPRGLARELVNRAVSNEFFLTLSNYLVTRDKDLLTLGPYQTTSIITPEEFFRILLAQQQDDQSTP